MRRFVTIVVLAAIALCGCDRLQQIQAGIQKQQSVAARGGAYLLLQVDDEGLQRRWLEDLSVEMADALRAAAPSIRYSGRGVAHGAARIQLQDPGDLARALDTLTFLSPRGLEISGGSEGLIEARSSEAARRNRIAVATAQAVTVLQRRFNAPDIVVERVAGDRISVHAGPRVRDPAVLRRSVGLSGFLSLHLVQEISAEDAAAGRVSPGAMVVPPYPGIGEHAEVVRTHADLTSEHLLHAAPSVDPQTGLWVISFQFDAEGARAFCRVTRQHTHERFAILLDNQVLTAPTINEPICGGSGQISGNFTPRSATDLAVVLSSGALPAPLRIIAEGSNYGS